MSGEGGKRVERRRRMATRRVWHAEVTEVSVGLTDGVVGTVVGVGNVDRGEVHLFFDEEQTRSLHVDLGKAYQAILGLNGGCN